MRRRLPAARRTTATVVPALVLVLAACGGTGQDAVSTPAGDSAVLEAPVVPATGAAVRPGRAAAPSPVTEPPVTASPAAPGYTFPVASGAARFGKAHHDYPATDIFAPCGTRVVAVMAGTVLDVTRTDTWSSAKNDGATRGGLSVTIRGDDGVRYYGSHFSSLEPTLRPGVTVAGGDTLGRVGRTGSAAGTPCHLHFGLSPECGRTDWWVRRGVVPPYEYLRDWRRGRDRSPVAGVAAWRKKNGCPRTPTALP